MRFRKIVIGVDFSEASLAAARWVADHLAPDAELLLVHVVSLPRPPIYLHDQLGATIDHRSTLTPRLYAALSAFGELIGSDRVRVGIRTGVAWSALARVATEVKADLICVGRGNKRKGSSRFGATTPQRLLAVAGVPVMVIPQGVITKPDRIVAALSARPGGEIVLPVAQNLASEWGASLEAIHVIEADVRRNLADSPRLEPTSRLLASIPSAGGRQIGIDALDEVDLRDRAIGWLTSTFSAVNSGVAYEGHIRMGDAGQELIAAVRNESGHPVIVMGRLGERVSALPIQAQYRCGSTTRMVLWAAPCPVLVVPIGWRVVDDLSIDTTMPARHIHLPDLRAGNRAPVLESMQGYSGDGNDAA
ncbi:MAG TPA: universal stress protein [Gemmatimonadaceae bacterium]|nr:universal stress protein [Gemmatimonadaceae bacterium]